MKTTQHVRQEKAIAAGVGDDIRRRWMSGLRYLRDSDVMAPSGKSMKHGAAEKLIAAAQAVGLTLSEREIRWRIQCARTYQTESQIGNAITDFRTWFDLIQAGFPEYKAPEGEPLADHRTEAEKRRDAARHLLDLVGEQGVLFPLDQFEPTESTLKDLVEHTEQGEELTARFLEHDRKRREYLDRLIAAAEGDLSMTWQEAQERLDGQES
jgi:hypothetical protein